MGSSRKAVRRYTAPQRNKRQLSKPKRRREKAPVMVRCCRWCGGDHVLGECPLGDTA